MRVLSLAVGRIVSLFMMGCAVVEPEIVGENSTLSEPIVVPTTREVVKSPPLPPKVEVEERRPDDGAQANVSMKL